MKINIIVPYRPSNGGLSSPTESISQDENFNWVDSKGVVYQRCGYNDIERCVESLNKNSFYKHNIIVVIDNDMFPRENWLKKFGDNIRIFKANEHLTKVPQERQQLAMKDAIMSINDDEYIALAYISDLVCGKNWDIHIKKAHDKYGDSVVYVPMFVEPRTIQASNTSIVGEEVKAYIDAMGDLTCDNIWGAWRGMCCHSLTLKPPSNRNYIKESDMDEWSSICNQFDREYIEENCGDRVYGYWAPLITISRRVKNLSNLMTGFGSDLNLDNSLGCKKIVVTKSHVFHFHLYCELDKIEVEHER